MDVPFHFGLSNDLQGSNTMKHGESIWTESDVELLEQLGVVMTIAGKGDTRIQRTSD